MRSPASQPVASAGKNAVRVSFAYSPEKEKLLLPLIAAFNREAAGGGKVFVDGINASSGDAESRIAKGTFKPVGVVARLVAVGAAAELRGGPALRADTRPSIVRTPLVIAMWEPMARALGWPKKKLGFADVLKLATSGKGWAAYGKPEFGAFKLVHTNPDFSTSGLSAVAAEYYAALGKKEGLTEKDIANPKARKEVRDIERSIVHYGDTTLFIEDQLRRRARATRARWRWRRTRCSTSTRRAATATSSWRSTPRRARSTPTRRFTLNAPWVTAAQRTARRSSRSTSPKRSRPSSAAQYGFRPFDRAKAPVAPITVANGADPKQPERVLTPPEPRVLAAIKNAWRRDRKPANILLVLDTSGSMNDEQRLESEGRPRRLLRNVEPQDAVGLTTFSDQIQPLIAPAPLSKNGKELRTRVRDLIADGGTAFYDATTEAFDAVRAQKETDRINAVVLLTDGEDTDSQQSVDDVIAHLKARATPEPRARVHDRLLLGRERLARQARQIAAASGG